LGRIWPDGFTVSPEAAQLVRELVVDDELREVNGQVLDALEDLDLFVG
jgi:hypothetical protein